jgi:glycosyltransferase involved in cell wall biosynthesis
MRILVCNWKDRAHPRAGGAEVWTHGVARAWVEAGHDVTLACSHAPGLLAEERVDGVEIVRGGDYRFGVHRHVRALYEARGGRFDLVLDEINTRPFGAPEWGTRSQVVACLHQVAREVWYSETPLPVALVGRHLLEPRWLRRYENVRTFVPSESTASSARRYGLRDVVVLPMGSEPVVAPTNIVKNAVPTFVFVGRMSAMKRPEHAVEAFRLVQREGVNARLLLIGRGPDERRVRQLVGDGVEWFGHVAPEVRNMVVARAHALVVTSVREGWGLVVSEAAAVGTPTIGYSVPGVVDSVHATGGILVESRPEALAAVMLEVASDPSSAPVPAGSATVPWSTVADEILTCARAVMAHA